MPSKSKAQQRFMGMVHAVQKGAMKAPSKAIAKVAKGMSKKAGHDFAATKHAGLPDHVTETIDSELLVDFNSYLSNLLEYEHRRSHKKDQHNTSDDLDNTYVKNIINKAQSDFPDIKNPQMAVLAYIGKKDEENERNNARTAQWINQTQQKIDQQQQSLGQHSADLQDKEARFKAQDQQFQDFRAQVAAADLNPQQQAQAELEFKNNPEQDPRQVIATVKNSKPTVAPKTKAATVAAPATAGQRDSLPPIDPTHSDVGAAMNNMIKTKVAKPKAPRKKSRVPTTAQDAAARQKALSKAFGYDASSASPVTAPMALDPRELVSAGEAEPILEGIVANTANTIEAVAKANLERIGQAYMSYKDAKLDFLNSTLPLTVPADKIHGMVEIFKKMPAGPDKDALLTNLLSNENFLIRWLWENVPATAKKVTKRASKPKQLPLASAKPNTPAPTPEPSHIIDPNTGQPFAMPESKNKIEDDLLLEYLVSLNIVLDNASK